MRNRLISLPPDMLDADLLAKVYFVQQVCILLVLQVGAVALCARFWALGRAVLPPILTEMPASGALAAFLCATALLLIEPERQKMRVRLGQGLTALAACVAIVSFVNRLEASPNGLASLLSRTPDMPPTHLPYLLTPLAFFLLAVTLILVRTTHPVRSWIADGLACLIGLVALSLAVEMLFAGLSVLGATMSGIGSSQTTLCFILLTLVVLLRRAECGFLSFFLGYGIGSHIARLMLPALIVLPVLLEITREKMIQMAILPPDYCTAFLAACAFLLIAMMLYITAKSINGLQKEIQTLTLRDGLTGLLNVKGFDLLAEQALLIAKRKHHDFGVLFVDLDDLKQVNDSQGHAVGSALLIEVAQLLRSTFRDTDVIGRIGGDEFAVAGEFNEDALESAITRLQSREAMANTAPGHRFPLRLSVGRARVLGPQDTLKQMITRADQAMYDNKRQKKLQATA